MDLIRPGEIEIIGGLKKIWMKLTKRPKFKVGDRVRIISTEDPSIGNAKLVVLVEHLEYNGEYFYHLDNHDYRMRGDELELVKEWVEEWR